MLLKAQAATGIARQELESYVVIEYLMELVKLEVQRIPRQQAS